MKRGKLRVHLTAEGGYPESGYCVPDFIRVEYIKYCKWVIFSTRNVFIVKNRNKFYCFGSGTDSSYLELVRVLRTDPKSLKFRHFKSHRDEIWQLYSSSNASINGVIKPYYSGYNVRPLLAVAYAAESAGCPLARRASVTSLAYYIRFSSWSILHSYLLPVQLTAKLEYLNLSKNRFGDVAGSALGLALVENISICVLDLSWNNIQHKGAVGLASGLKVSIEYHLQPQLNTESHHHSGFLTANCYCHNETESIRISRACNSLIAFCPFTKTRSQAVFLGGGQRKKNKMGAGALRPSESACLNWCSEINFWAVREFDGFLYNLDRWWHAVKYISGT